MKHEMGIDLAIGRDICVEERYMRPTPEYPMGSYLQKIDGNVQVAIGFYALEFPDKPSLHWHKGPPFVMIELGEWPWLNQSRSEKLHED